MKANRSQVEAALRARCEGFRFILLHGPDEAGSRALLPVLAQAMGGDAERVDLSGSELKNDPARLTDEAASISLFGGARYIVVESAGDEALAAVEALLDSSAGGNPILIVTGMLKPTSKLLKRALTEPAALALASYVPDGREAGKLVIDMARQQGLQMRPDVARRVAEAAGGILGIGSISQPERDALARVEAALS